MLAEDVAPEVRLHRNIRQAEIVPQVELERVSAVVVGCGAIGSWLARFLAHLGVPHFVLVDPDTVTTENLGLQGYEARDLDMPKAGAMARAIAGIHPDAEIVAHGVTFRRDMFRDIPRAYDRVAVFCCVDDIETRGFIYRASMDRCGLFVDGRMAALVWRVITVDAWPDIYYEKTLFRKAEAHVLRCTARGTVCTAAAPALQMATQCMLWLKGQRTCDGNLARDVEGNLLATTFEWIGTTEGVDSGGEGDDGLQDQDREVEAP
jgi:hypothetical protein